MQSVAILQINLYFSSYNFLESNQSFFFGSLINHFNKPIMMENFRITPSKTIILMVGVEPEREGIIVDRFVPHYEVLFAFDEAEAMHYLDKKIITLIIGNASNSINKGFDLCKKVKYSRQYCHIPVILLVEKNSLSVKIKGFEYGADAYVETPVSAPYLEAQVHSLLKNRNRVKEHYETNNTGSFFTRKLGDCEESFRHEVDSIIQQYLDDPQFDVELLAEKLHVSRPTLYRKIKCVTNFSPNDLINMARLEEALDLLSAGYRVYEVSDKVGYSSQSHFSRNFQKYYGMNPREYITNKKLSMVV